MVRTMPAGLLAPGACSGACLLAMEKECDCRCAGRFHGLLKETPIVVDSAMRTSVALAAGQAAEVDADAAVRMRAAGMSYGAIARKLGRSKSWAHGVVHAAPAQSGNGGADAEQPDEFDAVDTGFERWHAAHRETVTSLHGSVRESIAAAVKHLADARRLLEDTRGELCDFDCDACGLHEDYEHALSLLADVDRPLRAASALTRPEPSRS